MILLQSHVGDLEQHGWRDSVRIFGLSEVTPGSPDQKVLRLCNQCSSLQIDEITVSHCVGKVSPPADDGSPGAPRPLLVKFATRHSKNKVMEVQKKLKVTDQQLEDLTDEDEAVLSDGVHIYIGDDLTKARANLAFKARQAKRNKEISDTLVIDAKVMVKNNYATIFHVTSIQDLDRVKSQCWNVSSILHRDIKTVRI